MAIHVEAQTQVEGGFEKEIEKSSVGMMLDILQKYQYQYPIRSIIRELVSNGIDAIYEREAALSILREESKVEDHYSTIEGSLYEDSKFDPSYYNPDYLSAENRVFIDYYQSNMEKDYITITDNGVGLGGKRLQKYFNPGYSTKRLNKAAIGKFGLGNKSPLSIGPFYTVESRYNGNLFRFNVYDGRVESLIPRFNLETEQENASIVFDNGYRLYCEKTSLPNGVEIRIECKKHHRQQYIEAVKNQLLYFDNISLVVHGEDGHMERVEYRARIFYEDDHIILSDNSYWAKPHLLINRVNYGFIDFAELELEQKFGNIGIKMDPEMLDINPSREAVRWSEKTKNVVLEKFRDVVKMATKLVQEELKEFDFIKWVKNCYQLSVRYNSSHKDTVLTRLAGIIDLSEIEPHFPGDKTIRFNPNLFDYFSCREIIQSVTFKGGKKITKIIRNDLKHGLGNYTHLPIVISDERTSPRKDKYLLSQYTEGAFIVIKPPVWLSEEKINLTETIAEIGREDYDKIKPLTTAIWKALNNSSEVTLYSEVVVPEDFIATESEEEEEIVNEEQAKQIDITHEERRKLEGKTVIHTPRVIHHTSYRSQDVKLFEWQKLEVPIQEINDWDEEEIFYGNDEDDELLHLAAFISRDGRNTMRDPRRYNFYAWKSSLYDAKKHTQIEKLCTLEEAYRCYTFFDNPEIKIIKVAKTVNKLYRDFKHIKQFFLDIRNKTITMSNVLIKWNTARQIKPFLHKLHFLYNFPFDPNKQNTFRALMEYVQENGKIIEPGSHRYYSITPEAITDLEVHIEKVQNFQLFVNQCQDPAKIAEVAKDLWGNESITDGQAIDLKLWNSFKELLDWAEPIQSLLNSICLLTGHDRSSIDEFSEHRNPEENEIPDDVYREVQQYLQWKNVS